VEDVGTRFDHLRTIPLTWATIPQFVIGTFEYILEALLWKVINIMLMGVMDSLLWRLMLSCFLLLIKQVFVGFDGCMNHLFRPKGSLAVPCLEAGNEDFKVAEVLEPASPNGFDEVGAREPEAPLASLRAFP